MPSYSPVFSQGFIYYTSDTPNSTFLVPSGFTAVVRELDLYTSIGGDYIYGYVTAPTAPEGIIFGAGNAIGLNVSFQWRGRIVAPEGYTIGVVSGGFGDGDTVYVGGYLLRNSLS